MKIIYFFRGGLIGIILSLVLLLGVILSIYGVDLDNEYYITAIVVFYVSYYISFWWAVTILFFLAGIYYEWFFNKLRKIKQ